MKEILFTIVGSPYADDDRMVESGITFDSYEEAVEYGEMLLEKGYCAYFVKNL